MNNFENTKLILEGATPDIKKAIARAKTAIKKFANAPKDVDFSEGNRQGVYELTASGKNGLDYQMFTDVDSRALMDLAKTIGAQQKKITRNEGQMINVEFEFANGLKGYIQGQGVGKGAKYAKIHLRFNSSDSGTSTNKRDGWD